MKAIIKIEMDNAAFGEDPQLELARILKELASKLENFSLPDGLYLRDFNGNKVGALDIFN